MSDRHVRRSGSDYGAAFLNLLPTGQAWPRHALDSVLVRTVYGLSDYWGTVDARAADLLEQESDPRITQELLPDWERNWGLPDPCYQAPLTIGERQKALVMRMTMQGGQSRDFFISVAAQIGYTITISEFRTFVCGIDRCGDNRVYGTASPTYNEWGKPVCNPHGKPLGEGELSEWPYYGLGPPGNRFFWTVHVDQAKLIWFRCGGGGGQCGVDPHLRIGIADDLECLLNRWKPAHTQIIFDYSGLAATLVESAAAADVLTIYTGVVYSAAVLELAVASDTCSATSVAASKTRMLSASRAGLGSVAVSDDAPAGKAQVISDIGVVM